MGMSFIPKAALVSRKCRGTRTMATRTSFSRSREIGSGLMTDQSLCLCGCGMKVRQLFARGHNSRVADTIERRFWDKVDRSGDCWTWTGATWQGYGLFKNACFGTNRAHRISYEAFMGPVPSGLVLDHLCRNRACVWPRHMEPVSIRENGRRGIKGVLTTACQQGHAYDAANTRVSKQGWRECRECLRQRSSRRTAAARKVSVRR